MLLAIDIGNTNISLGVFKDMRLLRRYTIAIKEKNYLAKLRQIVSGERINQAVICSVVPTATRVLAGELKKLLKRKPYIIGKDIKVPMKNLYRRPRQLGQDRLVNAYAGMMLYGSPLITVDFGTAITFDVISRHKEYLGGMILPGLEISLAVLAQKTALLPEVKLATPKEFIGRDTQASILSGIVYGFACLADDLLERIKDKLGAEAKIIGTGGNAALIAKFSRQLKRIDSDLTLKGLNLIYRKYEIQ